MLHSFWLLLLNNDVILATFRVFGSTPVLKDKFIRVHHGSEIQFFRSFSILTVKLLGPTALFRWKVFNIFAFLLSVVEDKSNVLVLFFVKKRTEKSS